MWTIDVFIFVTVMLLTSALGIWKGKGSQSKSSGELLVGSNMSSFSVALSVCSSFLSAVSVMGFPSEVYYRGTMIMWFLPMYFFAFPIVAYVFLPTIFELKVTSLYEYLEKRFTFACRFIAAMLFLIQTLFYMAVALYAPALALSSCLPIPLLASIILTASLSAMYLLLGGARAGIYTSALQMLLILGSLFIIISASLMTRTPLEIYESSLEGGRLIFSDFRLDPSIRHSFFPLFFGGCTTIFSLFAANQLTIQRYISLPTLKKAQRVVLLNIPFNSIILIMYVLLGLVIYAAFVDCHPDVATKDQILATFVKDVLFIIPGVEGIFLAAIYSAGLSTLTASYSALTAVTLEDVIKTLARRCFKDKCHLSDQLQYRLVQTLPFCFASIASMLAVAIQYTDTTILQISFSIFSAGGGASLGIFVISLFFPWITSTTAALCGQISAICATTIIVFGSGYYHVKAVDLSLNRDCGNEYYEFSPATPTATSFNYSTSIIGTVTSDTTDSVYANISRISYHYYGLVGVVVCILVSHIVQLIATLCNSAHSSKTSIDPKLVAPWVRRFVPQSNSPQNPVDVPLLSHPKKV